MTSETNKYKNWMITHNIVDGEEGWCSTGLTEDEFKDMLDFLFETWQFQSERGSLTGKIHFQGCFRTAIRKRKCTILAEIYGYLENVIFSQESGERYSLLPIIYKNISIQPCAGTFEQALLYTSKLESRVSDPICSSDLTKPYHGEDVKMFKRSFNFYSWQSKLWDKLTLSGKKLNDHERDREIIWITDILGNTGKSKFVKFLCYRYPDYTVKLSFGTATQLRSAVIAAGPRKLYIVDIPRTMGTEDSIESLISVVEDIKNGFVVSSMYGKHQQLLMDPPQVLIFSNQFEPSSMMSSDRWTCFRITPEKDFFKL